MSVVRAAVKAELSSYWIDTRIVFFLLRCQQKMKTILKLQNSKLWVWFDEEHLMLLQKRNNFLPGYSDQRARCRTQATHFWCQITGLKTQIVHIFPLFNLICFCGYKSFSWMTIVRNVARLQWLLDIRPTGIQNFCFTEQPNTLKGWGIGALVSHAQDMFYLRQQAYNKVDKRYKK